jgi:hypothetical protein
MTASSNTETSDLIGIRVGPVEFMVRNTAIGGAPAPRPGVLGEKIQFKRGEIRQILKESKKKG